MKVIQFSKIKSTSNLFFKSASNKTVITDTHIVISTLPFFNYSGEYRILGIAKQNYIHTTYKVESPFDPFEDWFIYVSSSDNKIMVFNKRNEGVILKR